MGVLKPIRSRLALVGLAACLAGSAATARDNRPPPANERAAEHRRLTEEGQRASRAPQPGIPPKKAIVQTIPGDDGQSLPDPPPACPAATATSKVATIFQEFADVKWAVCVRDTGVKGLWVGPVYLWRPSLIDLKIIMTGSTKWMQVLAEAGPAEIFVPYHNDTNARLYDLEWTTALSGLTADDRGDNGKLRKLSNESVETVISEVRDRGVAFLCKQTSMLTRRGKELVVWAVSDAGNYDNIIEYRFRDDGSMGFRVGNTGYNSPSHPFEAHMHNTLWRVRTGLNGIGNDTAYLYRHNEPQPSVIPYLRAKDSASQINFESPQLWSPPQAGSLIVSDLATNAFGNRLSYEFSPVQTTQSKHFGASEKWTTRDIFVTRYHANEMAWASNGSLHPDSYVIASLNNESTVNADLVIWLKIAGHHETRREDGWIGDSGTGLTGITLVHWSGFEMEPHNLFDANPMGASRRCGSN
jgi:copper amine oxidase-like protein